MASELSKLIEDQLQKVDEEAGLTPTEKQRLLSSSLRIKTTPGKKDSKRTPIVKLGATKEVRGEASTSGVSVPVPSGQSWVTTGQGFQWTRWRACVGAGVALAIVIALAVAFSHPSSKARIADAAGYLQGGQEDVAMPLLAGAGAQAPVLAPALGGMQQHLPGVPTSGAHEHPIVAEHAHAAVEHAAQQHPYGAPGTDPMGDVEAPASGGISSGGHAPAEQPHHKQHKEHHGKQHTGGHHTGAGHHGAGHEGQQQQEQVQQQHHGAGAAAAAGAAISGSHAVGMHAHAPAPALAAQRGPLAAGAAAAALLGGALAPVLPPAKVSAMAPKAGAAPLFGTPGPVLGKALLPPAAPPSTLPKKSMWSAVKDKIGLGPPAGKHVPGAHAHAPAPAAVNFHPMEEYEDLPDQEEEGMPGQAHPAHASKAAAVPAAKKKWGSGLTAGGFQGVAGVAAAGGAPEEAAAAAGGAHAPAGVDAFAAIHGAKAPKMHASPDDDEEPEEEDDEAGILDTIAGTPYSSSDTTPGAAGEDEAEDDEWLNDDEEQGEGEDQEGEAGSTEGVYPYEEEDQQTTAAANPLAKG